MTKQVKKHFRKPLKLYWQRQELEESVQQHQRRWITLSKLGKPKYQEQVVVVVAAMEKYRYFHGVIIQLPN
jgi:hypothetical protein